MKALALYPTFIIVGAFLTWLSHVLKSEYLAKFLQENLVSLLVALLAINTTTTSLIVGKLGDMGGNFSDTRKSLRFAMVEQLAHVGVSVVTLVLMNSPLASPCATSAGTAFLTAVLCAALHVLWDTSEACFMVFDGPQNKSTK